MCVLIWAALPSLKLRLEECVSFYEYCNVREKTAYGSSLKKFGKINYVPFLPIMIMQQNDMHSSAAHLLVVTRIPFINEADITLSLFASPQKVHWSCPMYNFLALLRKLLLDCYLDLWNTHFLLKLNLQYRRLALESHSFFVTAIVNRHTNTLQFINIVEMHTFQESKSVSIFTFWCRVTHKMYFGKGKQSSEL